MKVGAMKETVVLGSKKIHGRHVRITGSAKTYHEGANDERTAILAKVRRMKSLAGVSTAYQDLGLLEVWLLQRNERYRKNPGSL